MVLCFKTTGTVSCDADGESQVSGCDAELVTWASCAICVASPSDDACETCQKQTCCTELEAFFGSADAASFLTCANACSSQPCLDGCNSQYPAAGQAFGSVFSCVANGCPACTSG
jgi:hypothetical protein